MPTNLTAAARAGWKDGLNATLGRLRAAIGDEMTIIGDGADNELPGRNGYMIQSWLRGGDVKAAVAELQQGPDGMLGEINCAECHHPADTSLAIAVFLLGVKERQYFGNNDWSRCTEAYALRLMPELRYPLGAPVADASMNGSTFTRRFGSGTHVQVDAKTKDYCVRWSNNSTTGNACGNDGRVAAVAATYKK